MTASVLEFGSDAFSREMLHICPMRSAAAYLEAFEQMRQGVFEGPEGRPWTNGIINLRVRRTDRLADWLAEYRRAGRLK